MTIDSKSRRQRPRQPLLILRRYILDTEQQLRALFGLLRHPKTARVDEEAKDGRDK